MYEKNFNNILKILNIDSYKDKLKFDKDGNISEKGRFKFNKDGKDFIIFLLKSYKEEMLPYRKMEFRNIDYNYASKLVNGFINLFKYAKADDKVIKDVTERICVRIGYYTTTMLKYCSNIQELSNDCFFGESNLTYEDKLKWLERFKSDIATLIDKWKFIKEDMIDNRDNIYNDLYDAIKVTMEIPEKGNDNSQVVSARNYVRISEYLLTSPLMQLYSESKEIKEKRSEIYKLLGVDESLIEKVLSVKKYQERRNIINESKKSTDYDSKIDNSFRKLPFFIDIEKDYYQKVDEIEEIKDNILKNYIENSPFKTKIDFESYKKARNEIEWMMEESISNSKSSEEILVEAYQNYYEIEFEKREYDDKQYVKSKNNRIQSELIKVSNLILTGKKCNLFLEDLPQKIRSLNIDKYKIIILYTSENTVVYNSVRRIYNNKQLDKMEIDILNQENLLLEFLKAHSSDNCVIVTIANTETIKRVIEICEKLDIVCFINVPTDWSFKDMKLAPLYFDVFDDNKTILNMYNPYYTFSISEEYTIDTFIDKYLELLFNFFIIDDACWVEIFKNFVIEMRVAIEKYLEKGKHSKLRLICMNYVSERELLYYSKSENIFIVDTMVDKYINTNDRYFKTSLRSIIFLRWLQYMQVKAEDKKIFASKISEIFLETETIKNTPKEYDKITKSIRRFENIFLNFGFLSNVDDIKAYEDVNIRELAESIKKDPDGV